MPECQHMDFVARVEVSRIYEDGADVAKDSPHTFHAEITVRCAECDEPFGWRGVPPGLSFDDARVSVDGLSLRVPLRSPAESALIGKLAGLDPDFVPPGVPRGFTVEAR